MSTAPIQQGSSAWKQLRSGDVTASRFKDVIRDPRLKSQKEAGELSESAKNYMDELIAARLGVEYDPPITKAMEWGKQWEATARALADEAIRTRFADQGVDIAEGDLAYITHPTEKQIGCSLDGLVGKHATLEIKCPFNPANHVKALRDPEWFARDNYPQIQGGLWIAERHRCYAVSFHPDFGNLSLVITPTERDEIVIKDLSAKVLKFRDVVHETFLGISQLPF